MDPLAALSPPVVDALAGGWTVLTGNQRAARSLRRAFDMRQQSLGLLYWQPPEILAWDTWLAALWHRLLLGGHTSELLLNPAQEHSVWRAIVAADPAVSGLRPLDSLADLAGSAWSRLHSYRASHMLHSAANTADTRAFARWASEFERRCLRSGFLTTAQLPERLAADAAATNLPPPSGLLLLGFDFLPPAGRALLDAFKAMGTTVREMAAEEAAGNAKAGRAAARLLVDAPDPQQELLTCAGWLRERLNGEPDARIAIIVPDIDADRAALDRALRNVLAPELLAVDATTGSAPFEFSLGVALDRTPIAAAALDLLRWAGGALPLDRVSALLLSPYFAFGETMREHSADDGFVARAELDAFVVRNCRRIEPRITPEELLAMATRLDHPAALAGLRSHLRSLMEAIRRGNVARDRGYGDWAVAFQQILAAAGWAAQDSMDSVEFQTRRKWESALDELASLDFDPQTPRVSFEEALETLERIAAQTLFAPESHHAPVQIMGPLEAAGSSFDAIWFLRANDLAWPPAPATHPLLPYSLQRNFSMPGADAAEDAAHARRMTARIMASTPSIVFSYADRTADGQQHPSPILSEFALEAAPSSALAAAPGAAVPIPLDSILDDAPIPAPPSAALRGGAAILQAQAACSFRAFAERRLFSTALERASLGLDARDRGSIVHAVLHTFWTEVRTQIALRTMAIAERDALLGRCIDAALARDHSRDAAGWAGAYLGAERERLMRLLGRWLDFEAGGRPPFVVKASEEQLTGVEIGPLHLDIRVDRVDETLVHEVSGGEPAEIILDYKTGQAEPKEWEGPRPDAPQLPLYAVVSPAVHLAAVAFANIRPGKDMTLAGYQSQAGILPSPKKGQTLDLELKRREWRTVLEQLAEEFHTGRAIADPKQYPKTCVYCRQRLLCRLELPDAFAAEDESADDEAASFASTAAAAIEREQP